MKHPAVATIITAIIGSVAIYEEVNCGANSALRGNAACGLVTLDCNRITRCSDYINAQIKAEKGPVPLTSVDPRDYLGMNGNEIISDTCGNNPCNLPFSCMSRTAATRGGGICDPIDWVLGSPDCEGGASLACTSGAAAAKCPADTDNYDIYKGFIQGHQQKGQLCEKDADCQLGTCSGSSVTINDLLVPCDPEHPDFRSQYNESTGCIYGISPDGLACGIPTEQYRRQANFYKRENIALRHCQ
jgi:hypothetical protein